MRLLLLAIIIVCPLIVTAQDECDIDGAISRVAELTEQAQEAYDANDYSAALDALYEAEAIIAGQRESCEGSPSQETVSDPSTPTEPTVVLNSAEEGLQAVISVELPTGFYRTTVVTNGYMIAEYRVREGECLSVRDGQIFNVSGGIAENGASTVFVSNECQMLIEISNTREPWEIMFTPMSLLPENTPLLFNSENDGMMAAIGYVAIPSGQYLVTATTDAYMIVQVLEISGTCDSGRGSLFNFSEGEGADGAEAVFESEDCVAVILVTNTREPWTLEFEALD
jgi:hypothetical protein